MRLRHLPSCSASLLIGACGLSFVEEHSKIENTVRCLGVDIEDSLTLAQKTEI